MNNKLKKCPFCGEEAEETYGGWASTIHKENCLFYADEYDGLETFDKSLWQSRPLEDALQKEVDYWQNAATVLSVKLRRAVEVLKYYALPPDEDEYNQRPALDALIDIKGE